MSRLIDDLKRYDDKGCESCHGFRPDVWVPNDDGGADPLCWTCAHAVLEHGMKLGGHIPDCDCPATDIFPEDVLATRKRIALLVDAPKDPSQDPAPRERTIVAVDPGVPAAGAVFTIVSPSYNDRGKRDAKGPVLVQQFRHVGPGRVEMVGSHVRPRIERAAHTQRQAIAKIKG